MISMFAVACLISIALIYYSVAYKRYDLAKEIEKKILEQKQYFEKYDQDPKNKGASFGKDWAMIYKEWNPTSFIYFQILTNDFEVIVSSLGKKAGISFVMIEENINYVQP